MAIVRYGSIITELKGKIGGQVFQGGNTVPIFRNNYAGSNRKRYVSSTENVIMSKLAHEWQLLTNSERLSWTTYANLFLVYNKFSQLIKLSPYPLFCHLNYYNILFSRPVFLYCPSDNTLPKSFSCTGAIDVGSNYLNLNWSPNSVDLTCGIIATLYKVTRRNAEQLQNKPTLVTLLPTSSDWTTHNFWNSYSSRFFGPLVSSDVLSFVPVVWNSVSYVNGLLSASQSLFTLVEIA